MISGTKVDINFHITKKNSDIFIKIVHQLDDRLIA